MTIHYNFYVICLLVLSVVTVLLFLLRKLFPHPLKEGQQQVLVGTLSFFFAVYAFFLSFSLVTLWQTFNSIQNSVSREANALVVSYRLSQGMEGSEEFRQTVKAYLRTVIDEEWPAMDAGRMGRKSDGLHDRLWLTATSLKPLPGAGEQAYKEILESLKDYNEARIQRSLVVEGSLPKPMWLVLIMGGVCSAISLYFLSLSLKGIQLVVDIILLGIIVFSVLLISEINRPFHGYVMITDKPFRTVYEKIERTENEGLRHPHPLQQ